MNPMMKSIKWPLFIFGATMLITYQIINHSILQSKSVYELTDEAFMLKWFNGFAFYITASSLYPWFITTRRVKSNMKTVVSSAILLIAISYVIGIFHKNYAIKYG